MSVDEVFAMFSSDRVTLHLDESLGLAMRDLGNAGPMRMVLPFADGLSKFFAPQSSLVPASIEEIVSKGSVDAFRGAMHLTHQDFQKKAAMK